MDPALHLRVKEVLADALALPAAAREAFVARACGEDPKVRREVDSLLALAGSGTRSGADESFLATEDPSGREGGRAGRGSATGSSPAADDPDAPACVGPFRIEGVLGRGGMGIVYRARQEQPVRRAVALKVVASELAGPAVLRRFEAERQTLARLSHPNVAALHEAGATPAGSPWFAMELVDGLPITRWCDQRRLGLDVRLELFRRVCDGVTHAHRKGILHRDLKPSNVLVTEVDGAAVPKVIDFGIAKVLDRPLLEATMTVEGGFMGTPAYASPEAVADSSSVDARSDVYSLGVILYELLAGARPLADGDSSPLELLRRISEEDPPRPSTRWRQLDDDSRARTADQRGLSPQELPRLLDGDLDWIVMKAIAKDPARRYGSVSELADDLERHLGQQPVRARPPTLRYRVDRFVRRNRLAVGASALVLLLLVGGLVGTGIGMVRARDQAEAALQAKNEAETVSDYLVELFRLASPDRSPGEEVTARDLLSRGGELAAERLGDRPVARARFLRAIALSYDSLGLYDESARHYESARDLLAPLRDENPADWLDAQLGLALARDRQARWDDAHALYDDALVFLDGHPELPATHRARALRGKGYALHEQGRHDEARELLLAALEIYRAAGGTFREEQATVLDNLGTVEGHRGALEEAARYHRSALAEQEALHGALHPDVATALLNLSSALESLGRLDEAMAAARRSLDLRRQLHGDEHPYVASSLNNVAEILLARNEVEEAEAMWREALAIRTTLLGPDHPHLAALHNNLAAARYQRGDFAGAADELGQALSLRERWLGAEHPDVAKVRSNVGLVLLDAGKAPAAERELAQAQASLEAALGPDHPRTLRNLEYMALAQAARGRPEVAVSTLERVLDRYLHVLPPEHLDTAAVRDQLASVYLELGDVDRAEPLVKAAWDVRREQLPEDHPLRAASLLSLARVRLARGDLEEAQRLAVEALAVRTAAVGADHPDRVPHLEVLGAIDEAAGDAAAAEAHYREGLAILESRPVPPRLADPLVERLRSLLVLQGRGDEARRLPTTTG